MTTLGSLTFAAGGISGYERTGDTVHMVVHAFTSEYQPSSFTVTFQGVTDLIDADRWDEKIATEGLTQSGGLSTLTFLDRAGQTLFAVTFASFTISESEFVPTVETLNFTIRRNSATTARSTDTSPDYVFWIGAGLIVIGLTTLVLFGMLAR